MSPEGRSSLGNAFRFAWRGLLDAALTQRNMRLHLPAAILVGAFGGAVPLDTAEQLALLACVFLVVAAEVMNTAVEAAVDLATPQQDERARLAKDAAAGAVLVLSVGAVAVLAVVLARHWSLVRASPREVGRALAVGAAIAGLAAWLLFPVRWTRGRVLVASAAGGALLVALALFSRSPVFTGVAALAFAVCVAAAAYASRR